MPPAHPPTSRLVFVEHSNQTCLSFDHGCQPFWGAAPGHRIQLGSDGDHSLRPSARTGFVLLATAAAVAIAIAGALLAPYIYAEYEFDLHGEKPRVLTMPVEPVAGRWFDDYFVVETLDPTTFAIGGSPAIIKAITVI